jgi:hypothetical protein
MRESKITPVILLVDNGSLRADATLQLRVLAKKLSAVASLKIQPVSLQHADKISKNLLNDRPVQIFHTCMEDYLSQGRRRFIILPLFFGESKAITAGILNPLLLLQKGYNDLVFQITDVICPLPAGGMLLADIIYDHFVITAKKYHFPPENIVLVDHGSPLPRVTAVRKYLVSLVQKKLSKDVLLEQAVMERRKGAQYLFNGELLEEWLTSKAKNGEKTAIVGLLFFLAGRHAGEGGDIDQICQRVMKDYPAFKIAITPLIAEHELLLSILLTRLARAQRMI